MRRSVAVLLLVGALLAVASGFFGALGKQRQTEARESCLQSSAPFCGFLAGTVESLTAMWLLAGAAILVLAAAIAALAQRRRAPAGPQPS